MCSTVRVFYPHHPLHGEDLAVVRSPKGRDGYFVVRRVDGIDVRVPAWMLRPAAASATISARATLGVSALRAVLALVARLPEIGPARDGDDR